MEKRWRYCELESGWKDGWMGHWKKVKRWMDKVKDGCGFRTDGWLDGWMTGVKAHLIDR